MHLIWQYLMLIIYMEYFLACLIRILYWNTTLFRVYVTLAADLYIVSLLVYVNRPVLQIAVKSEDSISFGK